jgi:hypothetical protein
VGWLVGRWVGILCVFGVFIECTKNGFMKIYLCIFKLKILVCYFFVCSNFLNSSFIVFPSLFLK